VYRVLTPMSFPAMLLAVCWLAMWFGFRARSPTQAVGLTVFWTILVPYVGQSMLSLAVSFLRPMTSAMPVPNWIYLFTLLHLVGGLAYAVGLIFWARHQLLTRVREVIAGA